MEQKQIIKIGLTIILGIVLVYLINLYYNNQTKSIETFDDTGEDENGVDENGVDNNDFNNANGIEEETNNYNVRPSENIGNNTTFDTIAHSDNLDGNQVPNDCFPKDKLSPKDLLPGDANSQWAQVNPTGQGELSDQNFLDAGYHVGVNTVGQTLRNANLQIRSEPPNPQVKVSPWLQTTIEPDTNRQPIEIGGCE